MSTNPPFGFRSQLVKHPEEQEALETMLALHRHGASLGYIVRHLTRHGYKPRGTAWRKGAISKIIKRNTEETLASLRAPAPSETTDAQSGTE